MKEKYYMSDVSSFEKKNLLYQTYKNIFDDNWNKENFLSFSNYPYIESFLLYGNYDFPIGVGIFSKINNEVEVLKFGIESKYRQQGFGYYYLKYLIDIYKIKKIENIFLEVSVKNTYAIKLYLKLGFKKLNIRDKYYKNNYGEYEDAIVMKKKIRVF